MRFIRSIENPQLFGGSGQIFKNLYFSQWWPLLLSAFFWLISLPAFDVRAMSDLGLVSVFPPAIILAFLFLIVGFASLFFRSHVPDGIFIAYIAFLVLIIHGTPQILYGTLRYSWAWKHVGIVDYIIRNGSVDPHINILGVYHNWPGFFALNALISQLAGFSGSLDYAGWAPLFFELFFALALAILFRQFTQDPFRRWLAVWLFVLANWVGQDYFSPQALTFLILIGVNILVLRVFTYSGIPNKSGWVMRLSMARWMPEIFRRALQATPDNPAQEGFTMSQRWITGFLILSIFLTIASSHQLTPFMGLATMIILTFFGFLRWRSLPIWMGICIGFWILFPARVYNQEIVESILESFGKLTENIDSGLVNLTEVSTGQMIVAWMGRGLTVGVLGLAALGVYRRARHGALDLILIPLLAAPVSILFLNTYGGEVIFRVYLFSLPYLAFLATGAFIPIKNTERKLSRTIFIGGVSIAMLTGMLFAYYGKEKQYYFTELEVEAAEYVYSHIEPNSLLVEGARNYPSQFLNYDYITYVPIDREPANSRERLLNDPAGVLEDWLSNPDYSVSFLIITRSQKAYADSLGVMPPGSLDRVQQALENSSAFDIVFSNEDAIVFTIHPEP